MPADIIACYALGGILFAIGGLLYFLSQRSSISSETLNELKGIFLQLFLFAEKQDWLGPEKMEWCIQHVKAQIPYLKLSEETIRYLADDIYEEYRLFIKEVLKQD